MLKRTYQLVALAIGVTTVILTPRFAASSDDHIRYVDCSSLDSVPIFAKIKEGHGFQQLAALRCGQKVEVLSENSDWSTVRVDASLEGYVSILFLTTADPRAKSRTRDAPPDSETRNSSIPAGSGSYPLSIFVLQTEQVPYSVQYGGGGFRTNCSINGSTFTSGSASSIGNIPTEPPRRTPT